MDKEGRKGGKVIDGRIFGRVEVERKGKGERYEEKRKIDKTVLREGEREEKGGRMNE